MSLDAKQRKQLRTIGHQLHPVVTIATKGLSESVHEEIERALQDHELIKLRINVDDRDTRRQSTQLICQLHQAELVQEVGKMALLFRSNPEADPRKSNLHRHLSG